MNIDEFVDRYKASSEAEFYERIKNSFDADKLIQLYGRSITIFEIMVLLQKKAAVWKLDTNRDRLYSALSTRLTQQHTEGTISIQNMSSFDEDLHFLVQKVVRENQIPFYDGEFRIISPKLLTQTYNNILKSYILMRFETERDYIAAFEKAESELQKHIKTASSNLRDASLDTETLCFMASYYRDLLTLPKNQVKAMYSQKITDLKLPERLAKKYALSNEEKTALSYIIYKAVKTLTDSV
ncbi:hypothetical protein ACFLQI_00865 [Candidatus Undinarchaeota archaeon]